MKSLKDPVRTALRRACVRGALDGWTGPIEQTAAVVRDDEKGLRVELGQRAALVDRLERMVKSAELSSSIVAEIREMLAVVEARTDVVPVFVLGESQVFLEVFDARRAAAARSLARPRGA